MQLNINPKHAQHQQPSSSSPALELPASTAPANLAAQNPFIALPIEVLYKILPQQGSDGFSVQRTACKHFHAGMPLTRAKIAVEKDTYLTLAQLKLVLQDLQNIQELHLTNPDGYALNFLFREYQTPQSVNVHINYKHGTTDKLFLPVKALGQILFLSGNELKQNYRRPNLHFKLCNRITEENFTPPLAKVLNALLAHNAVQNLTLCKLRLQPKDRDNPKYLANIDQKMQQLNTLVANASNKLQLKAFFYQVRRKQPLDDATQQAQFNFLNTNLGMKLLWLNGVNLNIAAPGIAKQNGLRRVFLDDCQNTNLNNLAMVANRLASAASAPTMHQNNNQQANSDTVYPILEVTTDDASIGPSMLRLLQTHYLPTGYSKVALMYEANNKKFSNHGLRFAEISNIYPGSGLDMMDVP